MLAVHWIPQHRGQIGPWSDADVFRAWQPAYVKLVWDGSRPPYLEDLPPAAKIIWRNYPLSEQFHNGLNLGTRSVAGEPGTERSPQNGSPRDGRGQPTSTRAASDLPTPEQAAAAYAQNASEVADYCRAQGVERARLLFEGPNEYPVWAHGYTGLARLETERARLLHRLGLRGVFGNLGVGWPGNTGPDTPPVWDWARPVVNELVAGDYWGDHEYWGWQGPQQNWGWWAGRLLKRPYRVPTLVTECGVDGGVVSAETQKKGWLDLGGTVDECAERYLTELWAYCNLLRADGRVRGALVYTYDGNRRDWGRFDLRLEPFIVRFLARIRSVGLPAVEPLPVPLPEPPPAPTGPQLPADEPVLSIGMLADKVRWWSEEAQRQTESGNTERAAAIRYSLIRRDNGLLYRLERALKAGAASG